MTSINVIVDNRTESGLRDISLREGIDVTDIASRLLARAVRAARVRPTFDVEELRSAYAPFADEDLQLAEADAADCAGILADEDRL